LGDRSVLAADYQNAWNLMRELMRSGVDATCINRTLMVGGSEIALAPIGNLDDQHIVGDVSIVEDGLEAVTRAIVQGSGEVVGEAGGIDARLGLIERAFSETTILDDASAAANATSRVALNGDAGTFIRTPGGGVQLAPTAPVTVDQLVPGAVVFVGLSAMCRQVGQNLRVYSVSVDIPEGGDEIVRVNLQPVGTS
jgi:hypothetical protein